MGRNKIILLIYTLKYLRFKQVYFRLYYFIRNKFLKKNYNKQLLNDVKPLFWKETFLYTNSFIENNTFTFINITHQFNNEIDWNYSEYGKLWTYNLNYFDFLNQGHLNINEGLVFIKDYIKNDADLKDGKEPYPISLRGVNWIKFLSKNNISDSNINQNLYNHYNLLSHNLEFHLLGNHLLENGFSMLFGAYFFKDGTFYKKAKKILLEELNEQILNDGAHFELSPMYHQILLHRLLDVVNLIKNNPWKENELLYFLQDKAIKMLAWLEAVTYKNGNIPMVNDSSYSIAPNSKALFLYAKYLGLQWDINKLSYSGYRKIENNNYELFMDLGNVGPTYQPGHAHSDTLSFELYVNEQPVIVDTGISTYEKNNQRQSERSTASHNTVKIGDFEQTEVWGGFRVAKRAQIVNLKETKNTFEATHDGYKKINLLHTRKFIANDLQIIIEDFISNKSDKAQVAFFHFHPSIKQIDIVDNEVYLHIANIQLKFDKGVYKVEEEEYEYATGFNKKEQSIKIKVFFDATLSTTIYLQNNNA